MQISNVITAQSCSSDYIPNYVDEGLHTLGDQEDAWAQLPFCDSSDVVMGFTTDNYLIENSHFDSNADPESYTYVDDHLFYIFVMEAPVGLTNARVSPSMEQEILDNYDAEIVYVSDVFSDYVHAQNPSTEFILYALRLSKSEPTLDTEECVIFPKVEVLLDAIYLSTSGRGGSTDPAGNVLVYSHIGRLNDPFDVGEFTLNNFIGMDHTGPIYPRPFIRSRNIVEIDGQASPAKISDYVHSQLNPSPVPANEIAHPITACSQPGGTSTERPIFVRGDLEIDIDYCFRNPGQKFEWDHPLPTELGNSSHSYIYMDPDARIIVKSGNSLTISGGIILSCNTLWNSIIVEDGASLTIRNSYIRDGIHAIKVHEGGTVNVSNNIFDGNFISFYTPPNQSSGSYSINLEPFFGNEFIDESGLFPFPDGYTGIEPEVPFAAIHLNDLNNFAPGAMEEFSPDPTNRITNIPLGVYGVNSSVVLSNFLIDTVYENVAENYGGYGILLEQSGLTSSTLEGNVIENADKAGIRVENGFTRIWSNIINECHNGVELSQTRMTINIISENQIAANNYGVYHNNVAGGVLRIADNQIEMSRENPEQFFNAGISLLGHGFSGTGTRLIQGNAITLRDNSDRGIHINSVNIPRIRENTIQDEAANDEFVGINLLGSPFALVDYNTAEVEIATANLSTSLLQENSHSSRINCNTTVQSKIGLQVIGLNEGSEIKGNDIGLHSINGLLYGYISTNPQSTPHITGIQRHHGNVWDASYTAAHLGAIHKNDQSPRIYEQSLYFVDPYENPLFSTTRDPEDWFEEEMFGNSWTCPETMPESTGYDRTPLDSPTEWDEKLVLDFEVFDQNPFYDSWRYISERNLYERIAEGWYQASALNSTALDSFMQRMETSNIPVLYEVRQSLAEAMDLGEDEWVELESKTDSIYDSVNALFALDSLAWADTTSVDTAQWLNDRAVIVESLINVQSNIDDFMGENSPNIQTAVTNALSTLGELSPGSDPEAYEIQMLELIAQTVYLGDWDFTQQDRETIEEISDYCPAEGGSPVYWARNIRHSFEPGIAYNDTLCLEESGQRLVPEPDTDKSLNLYPNPASSEITVDIQGMDFDQWVIYSIDGKLVSEGRINQDQILNISTIGMDSGQYMLKLSGKDPTRIITFIIQNSNR